MPGVVRGRVDAYGTLQQMGYAPAAQGAATGSQPAVRKTTVFRGRFRRVRTFVLRPGPGILTATLTLRRGLRTPVRLRLVGPGGTTVASARGAQRATLQATVKEANYRLALRAQTRARVSFRLTLSYWRRAG
jgi:hypothetical protein